MNHCKTIAIVNQKGGVGKTTSTVNLGVGLAQAGNRVLLVDDDPQHSLTISLGIRNADDDLDTTLATAMQKSGMNPYPGKKALSTAARESICFLRTLNCPAWK